MVKLRTECPGKAEKGGYNALRRMMKGKHPKDPQGVGQWYHLHDLQVQQEAWAATTEAEEDERLMK